MQVGDKEIRLVQVDAQLGQAIQHGKPAFFAIQACVYDEVFLRTLDYIRVDRFERIVRKGNFDPEEIPINFVNHYMDPEVGNPRAESLPQLRYRLRVHTSPQLAFGISDNVFENPLEAERQASRLSRQRFADLF